MSKNGRLALILHYKKPYRVYDGVVAYDPKNDCMQDILELRYQNDISVITYVESLISPIEYYWNEEQHIKGLYDFFLECFTSNMFEMTNEQFCFCFCCGVCYYYFLLVLI